jgi:spore coat protein CotF
VSVANEKHTIEKFEMHSIVEAMRENDWETMEDSFWSRIELLLMNACEKSTTVGSRIVMVAESQNDKKNNTK